MLAWFLNYDLLKTFYQAHLSLHSVFCLIFSKFWCTLFTSIFASSNAIKAVILNVGKNPPDCAILDSWVFENFILVDEPFSKVRRSLETCVLVNDNLYRKSVWSLDSATTFYKRFKVAWVPFLILDFNLLSCELDNSIFKVLY